MLSLQTLIGNQALQRLLIQRTNGGSAGTKHEWIEMKPLVPVRARLAEAGYTVRPVFLDGLKFYMVLDHNVLIYETGMRYPELVSPILQFIEDELPAYRGIPIWHRLYRQALHGTVVPMGNGPPNFVTKDSAYVPFADRLGEATAAAKASTGESNPGQRGAVEDLRRFDPDDPDQQIGIIVKVSVSLKAGHHVCFFNPGELQVRGPVKCTTLRAFYRRDVGDFVEMKPRGTPGGPGQVGNEDL